MEINHNITIYQTLHGYRSGHKLISSSVELSDIERRAMLIYSDYSGSGIERDFTSYLTGYPLPSSKFYVFAKTWYADEMTRPGCVWTHSLLIDFTDLWQIKNMKSLLQLFRRPTVEEEKLDYSISISLFEGGVVNSEPLSKNFYGLSYELYKNSNKGLVVLANTSSEFEDEILEIWNWQWPRLKRNFTFSTGSISLRIFEGNAFDVQIAPFRRHRTIAAAETDQFVFLDGEKIPVTNEWISKYKTVPLLELQNFMIKYGSDVPGTKSNFGALLDSFLILESEAKVGPEPFFRIFETYFSEPTSARQLKLNVIDAYFKADDKNKYEILSLLLSSKSLSGINWDYKRMFQLLIKPGHSDNSEIIRLINKMIKNKLDDDVVKVLSILPIEMLTSFEIDKLYLQKLVKKYSFFQKETHFWREDSQIQNEWFELFKENVDTDWSTVTRAMLEANLGRFADEIHEILGDSVFSILLSWMDEKDERLPIEWIEIVRARQEQFFIAMSNREDLSKSIVDIALQVLNPYDKYWKYISTQTIERFLVLVNKLDYEVEITGVYTFFINASYHDNLNHPEIVNILLFQQLHNMLKDNIVEIGTWERFKWYMGRDLFGLVEQNYLSKLFRDKNKVPDWDRCEFLRRSFVASYLKYDWDPMNILRAVHDRDTFNKIVDFCLEIRQGYEMLKFIYKRLKSTKGDQSFHYKILKSVFN